MKTYLLKKWFVKNHAYTILLLMLMMQGSAPAFAQQDDPPLNYAGKDFWLTTQKSAVTAKYLLYISGAANANITLTVYPTNNVQTYTHQGGTVTRIILDATQAAGLATINPVIESVHGRSLHIASDTDIVVQFSIFGGANDDGSLIFPSDKQIYGNEFYLNGPKLFAMPVSALGDANGGFSIVSRCQNTILEITPSMNTATSKPAGVPFTVTLNKGEAYTLGPDDNTPYPDLSGTKIRVLSSDCCNPINVFLTYQITAMMWPPLPAGTVRGCCADMMYEQILPVSQWDTAYVTATFRNNPYNVMKIVSAGNNNDIRFDGQLVKTLQAGQYLDTLIRNEVMITADEPISITQSMISQSEAHSSTQPVPVDSFSDPSTLFLLPVRYGVKDAYIRPLVNLPRNFPTPLVPVDRVYTMSAITICSKTSNVPAIQLNTASISTQFVPVGSSGYSVARILLDTSKVYHLTSPERVAVYYYGAYIQGSSAFLVGDVFTSSLIPVFSSTADSLRFCENSSVVLSANPADRYLWSNGSQTQSITVSDTGTYFVQMFEDDSCGYRGATKLFRVDVDSYSRSTTLDTLYKCVNETLLLEAQPADSYRWHDGSTGQRFTASAFGNNYSVEELRQAQCSVSVRYFEILRDTSTTVSAFHLGNDTVLCAGDAIRLETDYEHALWSDGHVGKSLIVKEPGVYWAQVYDTCQDITFSDSVMVRDTICMKNFCNLVFPTAFSPNADGRNDVFRPVWYGEFTGFYMAIYNRWGEKIFQSYRKEEGWDGYYKGIPAEVGVYFYLGQYECIKKGNLNVKGEVTLIR